MGMSDIETAVRLLRQAQYVVAFTGAGISTPSGIPDFRSPASGLWEKHNPMEVASIYGFKQNPGRFYDWIRPLAELVLKAQPNPAHRALAQMEQSGKLKSVITQNIDMLHTRAGSQTVYEVHGHLREMTCIHCFTHYPAKPYIQQVLDEEIVPLCPQCNHTLKPNAILFGEQLPALELRAAHNEARTCDLMIVVGSSLTVYPAAQLPVEAHQSGAKLIFINLTATLLDPLADVVIHENAADVLPPLMAALEN